MILACNTEDFQYPFEQRYYFYQKMKTFCKKNLDIRQITQVQVLKGIFFETEYVCVLMYQFLTF